MVLLFSLGNRMVLRDRKVSMAAECALCLKTFLRSRRDKGNKGAVNKTAMGYKKAV
jgi:hypothetical protein